MYLACHSGAEETVKEVKAKTKNEKVFCIQCDLASLKSIQSFVDAFKKSRCYNNLKTKYIDEVAATYAD